MANISFTIKVRNVDPQYQLWNFDWGYATQYYRHSGYIPFSQMITVADVPDTANPVFYFSDTTYNNVAQPVVLNQVTLENGATYVYNYANGTLTKQGGMTAWLIGGGIALVAVAFFFKKRMRYGA